MKSATKVESPEFFNQYGKPFVFYESHEEIKRVGFDGYGFAVYMETFRKKDSTITLRGRVFDAVYFYERSKQ